jgi:Gpi18-like mannosyltransferase
VLLYLFGGTIWVGEKFGWDSATSPDESKFATLVIQLLSALADLLTAALLAWAMWGRSRKLGLLIAALYVFNPAVWYVSAVWGQTDSIYTLLLLGCVLALERKRVLAAWALYALALGTKLQAIALLPLLAAWSLARHRLRGLLGGLAVFAAVGAVLCAAWLLSGRGNDLLRVYTTPPEMRAVVSAYNFWYLVFGGNLKVSSEAQPTALPLTYREIGNGLFAVLALLIVALALRRKTNQSLAIAAAMLTLSMFLVLTQMHERHAYPALAFLAWGAAEYTLQHKGGETGGHVLRGGHVTVWWIYGLLTLTILFNVVTIVPFSSALMTSLVVEDVDSVQWVILKGMSLVVAAINIAILLWLFWSTRESSRLAASEHP